MAAPGRVVGLLGLSLARQLQRSQAVLVDGEHVDRAQQPAFGQVAQRPLGGVADQLIVQERVAPLILHIRVGAALAAAAARTRGHWSGNRSTSTGFSGVMPLDAAALGSAPRCSSSCARR